MHTNQTIMGTILSAFPRLITLGAALIFFFPLLFCAEAQNQQQSQPPEQLLAVTNTGSPYDLALTQQEKAWLTKHQTIRIAFDGYFPPYSFLNENGQLDGLAVDIIRLLTKRAGISIEISPKNVWKDLYTAAQSREIDMVATMGRQPHREEWFAFTKPYILKSMAIMTRLDNSTISGPENLAGKRIALVKSYQYVKPLLDKYPSIKPYYVDTMLDGLNAVAIGKADAAITFVGAGHYLQSKYQIANLKFAAIYDRNRFTESIAVRKDWPELAMILDKALGSISSQEMLVLQKKWLPTEAMGGMEKIILTNKEKAWIRNHQDIRLGIDPEFVPFEYIAENGTYSGIASDYIDLLNKQLGLNMQVVANLTWQEAIEKAKKGGIDVLPCVGITKGREAFFNYSAPYIDFHRVIITRIDTPFLTGLDDIQDLRVAVQSDTSHEGFLKDKTDITPLAYPTLQNALLAVSHGKADAFVGNIASATYWITKLNLTNLKIAAPVPGTLETLHVAVRKDWPELIGIINKALAAITPEEKVNIQRRWVAVQYTPGMAPETVFKYLAVLLGIMLLAASGFTIWNRALNKQVRQKTAELRQELAEREKAEEALQESEERFRHYFERANIGFALTSPEKGWLRVNQCLCDMFGYSEAEFLSKTWAQMTYPEDLAPDMHQFNRLLNGEIDYYDMDKRFYRKDGGVISTHVTISCNRDFDGSVRFVIATLQDISDGKQAEEALQKNEQILRLFVEHAPAAIAMFDRQMKYIVASRRFLKDYDLGAQNIIGRSHYDVFPDISKHWREIHHHCLNGAVEQSEEDPFPRADGEMDWVRWEIHPWYETLGEIGGIILFSEVITQRKKAEQVLLQHHEQLEELVRDRTRNLENKTHELERSQIALQFLMEDVNEAKKALETKLADIARMNNIFVNRELRMVELKERIKALERS